MITLAEILKAEAEDLSRLIERKKLLGWSKAEYERRRRGIVSMARRMIEALPQTGAVS